MKKVFITGANGFVGQHLVEELRDAYKIIGLAGSDKNKPNNVDDGVQYVTGDINSPKIGSILNKYRPEMIVHLAAVTQTWFSNPQKIMDVNLLGTINLYESIARLKISHAYQPKIIYVSSSEIYGKTTNPRSIKEEAPPFPVNHYAVSKVAADRLSYDYTQSHKLNIVIARPFTHTGPGQKEGFFVPDMVSQIVRLEKTANGNTVLVGNLDTIRDYLDVRDVVRAYRLLLEKDIPAGEAVNICSGKGVVMQDVLGSLLKMSSMKLEVQKDPKRVRPSDVPVFIGDNTKLKKLTGWKNHFSLDETLRSVLDDWRARYN